jgi:hypothetical protein
MKHIIASRKNYEYQVYDDKKDKTKAVSTDGAKNFYEKISKELENPEVAGIKYTDITLDEYNEFAELDKKDLPMEKALSNAKICGEICKYIDTEIKGLDSIVFAYDNSQNVFISEIIFV